MLRKILGVFELFVGLAILGWIGYNYLVEMQPAAKGLNPIVPLIFSCTAIYFGLKLLAKSPSKEVDTENEE